MLGRARNVGPPVDTGDRVDCLSARRLAKERERWREEEGRGGEIGREREREAEIIF